MVSMIDTSPSDGRALRTAFGRFATGVTVITTLDDDGKPFGITANSFASVSLDPPLLLWSPAKGSGRHRVFTQARHFAVHVMRDDQRAICDGFVKDAYAFDGVVFGSNEHGVPVLEEALARFECRRFGLTDAGDHTLVLGEVQRCAIGDGAPLTFFAGAYGGFATQ